MGFLWIVLIFFVIVFLNLVKYDLINTDHFLTKKLSVSQLAILSSYFPFYQRLPDKSKQIFEQRVARFIGSKEFIPRKLATVTEEMKLLISAAAIQLTFGLPNVYLSHFRRILVYPDAYYSTITRRYHYGEVNPKMKAIVFSWKSFVSGYASEEGINLGLHEMAHALFLENMIRNDEFDFLPSAALASWDQLVLIEMANINDGTEHPFFRAYAGTNSHEFFAVAVENFFERPKEFNLRYPKMYHLLCVILNQNPLLLL